MTKEEIILNWKNFSKQGTDFYLNPDEEHVSLLADGVLKNEKKTGLKLCPCRLRDGGAKQDLDLICPCNFKTHATWKTKGRCWCGLFLKKEINNN